MGHLGPPRAIPRPPWRVCRYPATLGSTLCQCWLIRGRWRGPWWPLGRPLDLEADEEPKEQITRYPDPGPKILKTWKIIDFQSAPFGLVIGLEGVRIRISHDADWFLLRIIWKLSIFLLEIIHFWRNSRSRESEKLKIFWNPKNISTFVAFLQIWAASHERQIQESSLKSSRSTYFSILANFLIFQYFGF